MVEDTGVELHARAYRQLDSITKKLLIKLNPYFDGNVTGLSEDKMFSIRVELTSPIYNPAINTTKPALFTAEEFDQSLEKLYQNSFLDKFSLENQNAHMPNAVRVLLAAIRQDRVERKRQSLQAV